MANQKISELPSAITPLQDSDLLPVVQKKSASESETRKVTVASLRKEIGGGGGWNLPEKYEFGNTYFRIKNMNDGKRSQILIDENYQNPTVGLYAKSDEGKGDPNTPWLKLYHNEQYASIGIGGDTVFVANRDVTKVRFKGKDILTANPTVTLLGHFTQKGGNVFAADPECVQIKVDDKPVFGANSYKTDLNFQEKTVFSAGPHYTGMYLQNKAILETGYDTNKNQDNLHNCYTELHIYNHNNNGKVNVLHSDLYVLNIFHKDTSVLEFNTKTIDGAKTPYSAFFFVDDTGNKTRKKVLEASPFYTALYFNDNKMLEVRKDSFRLSGLPADNGAPLPFVEKYKTESLLKFYDMSNSSSATTLFMDVSPNEIRTYRNINLKDSNKDIIVGTGVWNGENLKAILNNLTTRIATLENK